ncbi:MAG TPA: trypco2 family protein [Thermoanaerobaculia bacterium]|jgi:hypothetical protein|nr:trypco2 family protein [Thermoanaerobaculia bacterium]
MAKIALADMIEELRNELQDAVQRGRQRSVRFELGEVTLEAEVALSVEGEGKGSVKFWVFGGAEAKASAGKTQTHKLILKLLPFEETSDTSGKPAAKKKLLLRR